MKAVDCVKVKRHAYTGLALAGGNWLVDLIN